MAEILIHRCTLRVVRRGGWSWGPDPRSIAQEAVRILPQLLAKKLSELLPDEEEDREMAAPLRLRLSVRMSELVGGPAAQAWSSAPGATGIPRPLEQKMEAALRSALGLERAPRADMAARPSDRGAPVKFAEKPSARMPREGGALARLVLAWHAHGVLERRLAELPAEQVEAWHDRLWHAASAAAGEVDAALGEKMEALILAQVSASSAARGAETPRRRRLAIAAEVATRLSVPLTHSVLWRILDRLAPIDAWQHSQASARPIAEDGTPVSAGPAPGRAEPSPPLSSPAAEGASRRTLFERPSTDWEVSVACALPFLLLGPLARMGYMAALEAVLEAADLTQDAPLFAAALAYKVLDPPQRGWRRTPASLTAAAAMAGLAKPINEEMLVAFSRRIAPHTGALDLILADVLIAGHTPGESVTLHHAGSQDSGGYLAIDTQGCFPIAWTPDLESLPAILRRLGSPIVLITGEAAQPALLRGLDAGGITYVTGVPPTRGDRWRRIQQGSGPGWTNSSGPVTEPLRRAAREMEAAFEEARAFAADMVLARPAVVRAPSPELERSLTLAASVAAGLISWKLWQSRGRTSPRQAVELYADFDGRVRFEARRVHVALPLGRRHLELRENGLLAPVGGVPWLGGRRIEFGGG